MSTITREHMTREKLLRTLINLVAAPDLDVQTFERVMREDVRALIPFKGVIVGYGTAIRDQIYMNEFVPIDYNPAFIYHLSATTSFAERPLLAHWLHHQVPMLVTVENIKDLASEFELDEMTRFELTPMLIHGQKDLCGHMSSYFSFSQCTGDEKQVCDDLAVIMPFLHLLLTRAMARKRTFVRYDLSSKEAKIMSYMCKGYGNKEIAEFLACSPYTIKNQVSKILKKMDASNRTEAIYLFNTVFQQDDPQIL
jgi:DNA-binding CsgD family transcriptional regulator